MTPRLIKRSLRWKLLFTMMSLMISLLGIMTYVHISTQMTLLHEELNAHTQLMKEDLTFRASIISEFLAAQVQEDFSFYNFSEMNTLLKSRTHKEMDLKYGILMSTAQEVSIHTLKPELEQAMLQTKIAIFAAKQTTVKHYEYRQDNEDILEIILPINIGVSQWGVLRLGFSLNALQQKITTFEQKNTERIHKMILECSLVSGIFLVISFFVLGMFSGRLSKPITDLTKVAHQLALGDFTLAKSLSIKTGDEIEMLANTFVEMSENLKTSYEKLENYSYDLEDQVAKRTIELAEVRDQALAANETKSKFLATVSHEIRNPMHAIINTTLLLLKTNIEDKQRNHLNNVINVSNTLVFLMNDLLDIAKIEAGKLEIEEIALSLKEVLTDIENLTQLKASKKSLDLKFLLDKNIPLTLIGDSLRLKQILLNLVTNAIKFTSQGHILVDIQLLGIQPKKVMLKFSVADTGVGLTPKQVTRLFQSFSQVDKTIARQHGGTGLGLVICKQLVELMGGEISVESEPEKGSQFYFILAIKLEPQAYLNKQTLPKQFKNTRVLVVDDDIISRTVLKTYLESFGFVVDDAESGIAALKQLECPNQLPYSLILMDWEMPKMDGIQASKHINASQKINITPPIVIVTSRTQKEVVSKIDNEIQAILTKPVDPLDLLENIGKVLGFELKEHLHLSTEVDYETNLTGAKILIVDDDDINCLIAKEMLEDENLQVEVANGGKQAIEKIEAQKFDAVLMDLQMPEMDGYETCLRIRRNPRHKNLPIIALSGHAMSEIRDKCLQVGMNDYVSKPFRIHKLLKILERIISSQREEISEEVIENAEFIRIKAIQPFACLSGIDIDLVLERISGKTLLLKKLLFSFAKDFSNITDRIEDAFIMDNQDEAQRLIHSLKGVSGNLSALPLYDASKQLEKAIIDEPENFPTALIECDQALKQLVNSIQKLPK
ncbi:MAG: response regulator [Methylococcales bacterium]|nr:response regulator [Methylococcales bacterium]